VNEIQRVLATAAGSAQAPVHGPARPGEQRRSCLHPGLAKRILDWTPTVSLADGLARTLTYFETELDRPRAAQ